MKNNLVDNENSSDAKQSKNDRMIIIPNQSKASIITNQSPTEIIDIKR